MTLNEISRAIDSFNRCRKRDQQEKASFDYILADLLGASIARLYSKDVKYPEIAQVYPGIFDREKSEEEIRKRQEEATKQRLRQFAIINNQRFSKKGGIA